MNLLAVSLLLAAAAASENMTYNPSIQPFRLAYIPYERYPTCNIIDSFRNKETGEYHARHKCKTHEARKYRCSELVLNDCVRVHKDNGTILSEDWSKHPADKYRKVTENCAECAYYGFDMALYCLCGRGTDPDVFNWSSMDLQAIMHNDDGMLEISHGSKQVCASKEFDCP